MTQRRAPILVEEVDEDQSTEEEENEEEEGLRFIMDKLGAYTDGCACVNCNRKMATMLRDDKQPRLKAIAEILSRFCGHTSPGGPSSMSSAQNIFEAVVNGDAGKCKEFFNIYAFNKQEKQRISSELIVAASQLGQAEIMHLLIHNGANIEMRCGIKSATCLMHAAYNGHLPAVELLLHHGADLEAEDINGYTALIISTFGDRASAAYALLVKGAKVDAADFLGRTALHHAAFLGSINCVHVLLDAGASATAKTREGVGPMTLAIQNRQTDVMEALTRALTKMRLIERSKNKKGALVRKQALSMEEQARQEAEAEEAARQLLEQEQEAAAKIKKPKKKKCKGKIEGAANSTSQPVDNTSAHEIQVQQLSQTSIHQNRLSSSNNPAKLTSEDTLSTLKPKGGEGPTTSTSNNHRVNTPVSRGRPYESPAADRQSGTQSRQDNTQDRIRTEKLPSTSNHSSSIGPSAPTQQKDDVGSSEQSHHPPLGTQHMANAVNPLVPSVDDAIDYETFCWQPGDPTEPLRLAWAALLEAAAHCMEEENQGPMLRRMNEMMGWCVDAGISVKYGKKVQQRLECVGPARAALKAAVIMEPPQRFELQAALKRAKPVRSLLDPALVALAESLEEKLVKDEEVNKWKGLESNLNWNPAVQAATNAAQESKGALPTTTMSPSIKPPIPSLPDSLDDEPNMSLSNSNAHDRISMFRSKGGSTDSGNDVSVSRMSKPQDILGLHTKVEEASTAEAFITLEQELECVVCLSAPKQICCVPCGHVCMCIKCSAEVEQKHGLCPVCRAPCDLFLELLTC
ncbi:hypothetical protein CEUSTIGMA_g1593.t1 [Chlamydomonas eustigma]|uniref:RING-type domain-containing protein n=1 Tax=Chlamydomonas eustigma TaxID=1157962 RepID=A0A250WTI4_9CHLO|nr:hypothetical protein CEUSTIGMA_g1593.t1 [Chlamydomonas eustigma]|eukprot:GAX74144.1 hypothetical protein CEUSTIGMA_g1593.t1 [Chlamydomonas eustigma]